MRFTSVVVRRQFRFRIEQVYMGCKKGQTKVSCMPEISQGRVARTKGKDRF
jgi:hypothetical protein